MIIKEELAIQLSALTSHNDMSGCKIVLIICTFFYSYAML